MAIRILCCEEPFMEPDFTATQRVADVIVGYAAFLANPKVLSVFGTAVKSFKDKTTYGSVST